MDTNLTIKEKFENQTENLKVMGKWEDWEVPTEKYFRRWIEGVGGMDEWLGVVMIGEVQYDAWPHPVPILETQFGNHVYDPVYQKWIDDGDVE